MREIVRLFAFVLALVAITTSVGGAALGHFEVITSNGEYADDPGWNVYVDVWDGTGFANFTFYNNNPFQSTIAQIYFDDGSLLGISEIVNHEDYTDFNTPPTPDNLPGGNLLIPPFEADREFSIGAENPAKWRGVNEGDTVNEWVTIRFDLINGGTLDNVITELETGALRVGMHVIGLPDGTSESVILVPEPATICLLGLGAIGLLRKRKHK